MQLTTVGRTIWKGASQGARLAEAGAGDPDVQGRLRKVKLVKALREGKRSWGEIQELLGISRATYYRWERALRERGLAGLKPKSRRPKRTRGKVQWKPELLVRVEVLRRANPTWGRWPIWLTLRKEGFSVSERTVGRILAYLEGSGRVESVASFLARRGRGKGRGRPRRPYARRKPRGYQPQAPGDLIQVDTLMVSLGPGEVVRHFSAVDLFTRYALGEVHSRATARLAGEFLSRLVAQAPFPIRAVQVDGGSEFMAEFEKTCQGLGIALFVLPPRSPKLNGHVERLQRTFRDEFYTRPLPTRLSELQAKLDAYLDYYNRRRPHMALGGLAPLEFLAKIQEGSVPQGVSNVVANHKTLTRRRLLLN
ncbi:integrase core domain-containing protein [Thermus scotoductus]|uniref:Integrase n=1 Tax=Thermus scotoductus TaxID=37636 RepID=A0A430RBM7_THESC|nr:integrase core domain-containing protein [Thermus scotoductus]RTG96390.1 integrase [Thermus scotoductus]RTH04782.1 integrase [Thermus scotoductus]RTH20764.1 integrase [Thermus scotoductus]RTH96699.1 integrase [Thermus scotoductus]RTI23047.1 integrase [Thermus scotoductus]